MSGSITISPSRSGRRRPVSQAQRLSPRKRPSSSVAERPAARDCGRKRCRPTSLKVEARSAASARRRRSRPARRPRGGRPRVSGGEPRVEHRARAPRRLRSAARPRRPRCRRWQEAGAAGVEQAHRDDRADAGRTAPRSAPGPPAAAPRSVTPLASGCDQRAAGTPPAATGRSRGSAG